MSKRKMIEKILENQNRANDHIFTEKKLKSINYEMLSIIYEASQHMVTKWPNERDILSIVKEYRL